MDRNKQILWICLSFGLVFIALVVLLITIQSGKFTLLKSQNANFTQIVTSGPHSPYVPRVLPGLQNWSGVPSFLLGANDASWDWSTLNMGNNAAVRASVRSAGVPLIRTPLTHADAMQRVTAIQQTGAACLGILHPSDAIQVVRMLGQRCNLYEWEDEPDNNGISVATYASSWNQFIPVLRSINPQAAFIGPVVAYGNISYIQRFLQLTNAAGNLPDAVSYHMYPCTDQTIIACSKQTSVYGVVAQQVKTAIKSAIGRDLPQAVTEWNYSWKPGQTPRNNTYMQQFTISSIQAMDSAGIVLANQFDLASNAGNGSLDMLDPSTGSPYPQFKGLSILIEKYKPQH